jgi:DNA-binding CsgD family transcriptional regulator
LAELVPLTDSRLVGVMADHARALVASDPGLLLSASDRFGAMTAWWMAAESAAAAARIFERRGQTRAAKAATRAAQGFATRCDGMGPSVLESRSGPMRLTRRESEIAALAAAGRSSKEIAERMHLSPRTVENHLYHAYVKLGVTDRAGLGAALATAASPE